MTNDGKKHGFHVPEAVRDSLLFVLQWLVVTAGIFAWWMALWLAISFFAVNVWHITFAQILRRSIWLTLLCSAAYLLIMLRRDERKRRQ